MYYKKQEAIEYIKTLDDECIVGVKEVKESRSVAQNRLYFAYLHDIKNFLVDSGMIMTVDALHISFRDTFIEGKNSICPLTNNIITERKSTTKLNKKEFSEYIKTIQNYLISEKGIDIALRTDLQYIINKDDNS